MELITDHCGFGQNALDQKSVGLTDYVANLVDILSDGGYSKPESSICLPGDDSYIESINELRFKFQNDGLKYIILVGIGGSSLGARAIYDAKIGYFAVTNPKHYPKIIFLETVDSEILEGLRGLVEEEVTDLDEILVNVVSKSGTTLETVQNYSIVRDVLEKKLGNIDSRTVITTDKDSDLWQQATAKSVAVLEIPTMVGGRYSVFSAVGLFPLSLAGVDAGKLLEGAKEILKKMENKKDQALISASLLHLHYEAAKTINDTFLFHPELESLGKWYRQLIGESLGKDGKGMTPIVSIGSNDLHSVVQLDLDGPKDKITTFVSTSPSNSNETINSILEAIKKAYSGRRLPFMEIILDDLSESSLGEFMQFKMLETMYLAKLIGVNAFDQPAVEAYKREIKP